jgi:hypothetical protein
MTSTTIEPQLTNATPTLRLRIWIQTEAAMSRVLTKSMLDRNFCLSESEWTEQSVSTTSSIALTLKARALLTRLDRWSGELYLPSKYCGLDLATVAVFGFPLVSSPLFMKHRAARFLADPERIAICLMPTRAADVIGDNLPFNVVMNELQTTAISCKPRSEKRAAANNFVLDMLKTVETFARAEELISNVMGY